jgi:hypothetical protein
LAPAAIGGIGAEGASDAVGAARQACSAAQLGLSGDESAGVRAYLEAASDAASALDLYSQATFYSLPPPSLRPADMAALENLPAATLSLRLAVGYLVAD